MPLIRLLYYSVYRIDPGQGAMIEQLNDLLRHSNRNNQTSDITGALIFDKDWFLQVLEGPRDKVWTTFKRIEKDKRHSSVTPAELLTIADRSFGQWWMGCAERNEATEGLFAPHLREGKFDPPSMSSVDMMSLLMGMAKRGLERELSLS